METLRVGDKVWGYDPRRREPVVVKISHFEASRATETVRIDQLRLTGEHPVFVAGQWKAARNVNVGDLLFTQQLAERAVEEVEQLSGEVAVYDLQVEPPHNFFAAGVLVHNKP